LQEFAGSIPKPNFNRIEPVVEKVHRSFSFRLRLDDSDIGAALKKMGGEAVAQHMQGHALLDPGRLGRFMKQAAQLAGGHRLTRSLSAGK
jgi:hypothetical protein